MDPTITRYNALCEYAFSCAILRVRLAPLAVGGIFCKKIPRIQRDLM